MGGMRGGMGGMRGGCGAGAWAEPAFEAMMKGWMGEPQMGNQKNRSESDINNGNKNAHAAASNATQEVHKEDNTGVYGASSSPVLLFAFLLMFLLVIVDFCLK